LKDLGVDGRTILRWIFKKCSEEIWTGLIWLRIGKKLAGFCECGTEHSGFIKCGEFLDCLRTC